MITEITEVITVINHLISGIGFAQYFEQEITVINLQI